MTGSQSLTRARVWRAGRRRRWFSLSAKVKHRERRVAAIEIERLERLGDWPRYSGHRSREVVPRQRWF